MRVLIVDEALPYPPDSGKGLRTFNLVKRLSARHDIVYLARGSHKHLPECPEIEVVCIDEMVTPQHGPRFYAELLANIFSPLPYVVTRHSGPGFRRILDQIVDSRPFDLVHCEWTPYARTLLHLEGRIPLMLMTHNVESLIWARSFTTEANPFKKAYIGLQWLKMERFEAEACSRFDAVGCVSADEASIMRERFGCENVCVVPNGVDPNYFLPGDMPVDPLSMVFTGSLDWRPNQDAIGWFVKDVFPLIRKGLTGASLDVVGRNPPEKLANSWAAVRGVNVSGTVPDVRPHIARASLYVTPLRVGGGSRLKILEALAMGKPVLSTTIGAEGLRLRDGEHLVLRDDPAAFASQAVDMLTYPERYADMARRGRQWVLDEYGWDGIAPRLETAWEMAVAHFARRRGEAHAPACSTEGEHAHG